MTSRKFFSLFLLCALVPLAAAKLSLAMGWFSHSAVNKGYWMEREIELLPDADLHMAAWRLVYIAPEHCAQSCEQVLYGLQQLYTGFGRKQVNIQPLVIANNRPAALGSFSAIVWQSPENNLNKDVTDKLHDQIVIVNRDGLALLRYPINRDAAHMETITKNIRTDLLRLLNYDRQGT